MKDEKESQHPVPFVFTYEALKRIINEVLDERDALDHETHKADHEFIAIYKAREKRKQDIYQKAVNSIVGALAIGFVGALGWIGSIVIEYIKNGGSVNG